MTPEQLASIAGVILSLALAYIPPFANRYNQLDNKGKVLVMGGLLVVAAVGVFAYGCLPALVSCTVAGAKELTGVLISALVANQAVYTFLVRPFEK